MTFSEVTDSIEVANNIDTLCQARSYTLLESDQTTAASFLALTGNVDTGYTITASPTEDSHVGTHTFKLKTELDSYSGNSNSPHYTDIPVVVTSAACDQSGLGWLATAQVTATVDVATGPTTVNITPYTVDTASKTATAVMRACGGTFDETYTLAAVQKGQASLPSFITHSSGVLTVTPTTSAHMGTWTIEVT